MNCCDKQVSSDIYYNCCNANKLCHFNGDIDSIVTAPIYVQQVFDAVSFHMQGMTTIAGQVFTPAIPTDYRIKKVVDIRCKKFFNPENVDDPCNLVVTLDTSVSGATFLKNCDGSDIVITGPDGTYSEKILYADTTECDEECQGTPVFGTQTIAISGNCIVELDLLLCDGCKRETCYTVCANVEIAPVSAPMILTNFFEICMPSTFDTAFYPRFTEFCNTACEGRLATNNCGRDLSVDSGGCISGNLILAICVNCEKKIVVPVQLCVLSSGYVCAPTQHNSICSTFPSLFPEPINNSGNGCCDRDNDHPCDDNNSCNQPPQGRPRPPR